MINYKLKYRNAEKRWKKAINRYFNETGIKISPINYFNVLYIDDPENEHIAIYNPQLPKYLTSADAHLNDMDDEYIMWQNHHRSAKRCKQDYITRLNDLRKEKLSKKEFEKEKYDLWKCWRCK